MHTRGRENTPWGTYANTTPYRSFQRHGQQLSCLNRKLHGQFVEHIFSVTVHNKSRRRFGIYAARSTIEHLLLRNFGSGCLMFHYGSVVMDIDVRKRVRSARRREKQRIARAVIAGFFRHSCPLSQDRDRNSGSCLPKCPC